MNSENMPIRKKIRLENYDYSQNGVYFITVCTKDRVEYFGEIKPRVGANCVRPECTMTLSEYGSIVKNELIKINSIYQGNVIIDKFVIMPNHIHMIIKIYSKEDRAHGRTQFDSQLSLRSVLLLRRGLPRRPAPPTISRVIKQFKGSASKKIGFSIWQRSFFDRIIRNEKEYLKITEYIENNPINWENDELFNGWR